MPTPLSSLSLADQLQIAAFVLRDGAAKSDLTNLTQTGAGNLGALAVLYGAAKSDLTNLTQTGQGNLGALAILNGAAAESYTPGWASTASQTRDLRERLGDQRSLLDAIPATLRGAIKAGTCTTDVSGYIQAALNAFAGKAGQLYVPQGVYPYAATVSVPAGIMIVGAGRQSTIFRALPGSNVDYFLSTAGARSYLGTGYDNGATLNIYKDFSIDCNGAAQTTESGGILHYGGCNIFDTIAITNHLNICAFRTEYPLGLNPGPFDQTANLYRYVSIANGTFSAVGPTDPAPENCSMYLNGPSDSFMFGGGVGFCEGYAYQHLGAYNTGMCVFGIHNAGQTYYGSPAAQWNLVNEGGGSMFTGCVFEGGLYGQVLARAPTTICGGQIYSQGTGIQIGDSASGFTNVGVVVRGGTQILGMLYSVVFDSDSGSIIEVDGFSNCVQLGSQTGKTQAGSVLFNNTGTYTPVAGDIPGKPYSGTPNGNTVGHITIAGTAGSHGPNFYRPTLLINRAYASDSAAASAGIALGEVYLNTSVTPHVTTIRVS